MQTCTLQPSAVDFSHTLGANAVGVFSPFNCQILQDEGSVIPHLLLRILDEDAAQPNMLLAVGGSHTLGASLVDVFFIYMLANLFYTRIAFCCRKCWFCMAGVLRVSRCFATPFRDSTFL